jgi:DNA polymerase-1
MHTKQLPSKFVVIDLETTGLDWKKDRIHGIGACIAPGPGKDGFYVPAWEGGALIEKIKAAVEDPSYAVVGHNLRFDLRFLSKLGWKPQGEFWDTKIMAQLVNENMPLGLKPLSEKYVGKLSLASKQDLDYFISQSAHKTIEKFMAADLDDPAHANADLIGSYCQEDCRNTYQLLHLLWAELQKIDKALKGQKISRKSPLDYLLEEALPVEPILLAMELRGVKVNVNLVYEYKKHLETENYELLKKIHDMYDQPIGAVETQLVDKAVLKLKSEAGRARKRAALAETTLFTISNDNHFAKLLYEQHRLPKAACKTTKSGKWNTSEAQITEIKRMLNKDHEALPLIESYQGFKKNLKNLNTYTGDTKGLLSKIVSGRVHGLYHQTGMGKESSSGGTVTGRLSSTEPNMQNLPRLGMARQFFVPDNSEHVFLYFDFSQLELRIAAHLSRDEKLIEAYRQGIDLHMQTAVQLFDRDNLEKEQRQVGKTFNFALIYDAKSFRLHSELLKNNIATYTQDDVEEMRLKWFDNYRGYAAHLARIRDLAHRYRAVVSAEGRVRRLPEVALGSQIDWRNKRFKGNVAALAPGMSLSGYEAFMLAKKRYNHAVKQAYNFPIQSLGASMAKRAMVALVDRGFSIVTQVHDSIIMQIHKPDADGAMLAAQETIEGSYKLLVPVVAEGKFLNSFSEKDVYVV